MLTRSESFCKWMLLVLLIASLSLIVVLVQRLMLPWEANFYEAIIFFALIITVLQAIPGLLGWFALHRGNEGGRRAIMAVYIPTLLAYGGYSIFLLITLFFPNTFQIIPMEILSIIALFIFNVAVFILQHFWTRDLY